MKTLSSTKELFKNTLREIKDAKKEIIWIAKFTFLTLLMAASLGLMVFCITTLASVR